MVWFFGGQQVLADEITLSALLAFYSYMWLFLRTVGVVWTG